MNKQSLLQVLKESLWEWTDDRRLDFCVKLDGDQQIELRKVA